MLKRFYFFLLNKKARINSFSVFFLGIFYIASLLPSFQCFTTFDSGFILNPMLSNIYKALVFGFFILDVLILVIVNKPKIDFQLTILLFLYIFLSLFPNLFLNKHVTINSIYFDKTLSFSLSFSELISSSIFCLRFIFVFYFMGSILPLICDSREAIKLLKLVIIFALFSILYVVLFQWKTLINTFFGSATYSSEVTSFYLNKNTHGIILTVASLCALFLFDKKKWKKLSIFSIVVFLIFELILFCRTALMLTMLSVYLYLLLSYIKLRRNKIMFWTITITIFIGVIFLIINNSIPALYTSALGSKIYEFSKGVLNDLFTANGRLDIVPIAFDIILDPIRLFFGYGDNINGTVLHEVTYFIYGQSIHVHYSYHNTIIELITSGGLFRTFVYIYLIYKYAFPKNKKQQHNNGRIVSIISILIYIAYSFFEEIKICDTLTGSLCFTLLLFLSQIYYNKECMDSTDDIQYESCYYSVVV